MRRMVYVVVQCVHDLSELIKLFNLALETPSGKKYVGRVLTGSVLAQVCAKVFGNASALAKHKLTHSDERKYVCTMCGKAFKRQDHL
jgi:hypothetical protein